MCRRMTCPRTSTPRLCLRRPAAPSTCTAHWYALGLSSAMGACPICVEHHHRPCMTSMRLLCQQTETQGLCEAPSDAGSAGSKRLVWRALVPALLRAQHHHGPQLARPADRPAKFLSTDPRTHMHSCVAHLNAASCLRAENSPLHKYSPQRCLVCIRSSPYVRALLASTAATCSPSCIHRRS
jgi:hypothetical protein